MMSDSSDRTTVVVGASRGLGRGIARGFAEAGAPVVAVARSGAALAELAATSANIRTEVADATDATNALGWRSGRRLSGSRACPKPPAAFCRANLRCTIGDGIASRTREPRIRCLVAADDVDRSFAPHGGRMFVVAMEPTKRND